jgi:hypothetical protein
MKIDSYLLRVMLTETGGQLFHLISITTQEKKIFRSAELLTEFFKRGTQSPQTTERNSKP